MVQLSELCEMLRDRGGIDEELRPTVGPDLVELHERSVLAVALDRLIGARTLLRDIVVGRPRQRCNGTASASPPFASAGNRSRPVGMLIGLAWA